MSFHRCDMRTARKVSRRKCEHCGRSINIGEKYYEHSGKHDGDFFYYKVHPRCGDFYEYLIERQKNYDSDTDGWMEVSDFISCDDKSNVLWDIWEKIRNGASFDEIRSELP